MKWRVIPLETHDAYANMAFDEAVAEHGTPTIRFYRWRPSAVSIGYFQAIHDVVDLEACRRDSVDYVRRRTGGGAVYHDYEGEVTYSIIAPVTEFPRDLTESYRLICGYVVEALESLGVEAEFEPINDIATGGRKISGNAQTRRDGVLVQHGTVLHRVNPEQMFTYLRPEIDKVSDKIVEDARDRVTSVEEQVGCSLQDTYMALRDAFTMDRETYEDGLSEEEEERAEELVHERYATDGWNFMR